jgi:hypothetical protein
MQLTKILHGWNVLKTWIATVSPGHFGKGEACQYISSPGFWNKIPVGTWQMPQYSQQKSADYQALLSSALHLPKLVDGAL